MRLAIFSEALKESTRVQPVASFAGNNRSRSILPQPWHAQIRSCLSNFGKAALSETNSLPGFREGLNVGHE